MKIYQLKNPTHAYSNESERLINSDLINPGGWLPSWLLELIQWKVCTNSQPWIYSCDYETFRIDVSRQWSVIYFTTIWSFVG